MRVAASITKIYAALGLAAPYIVWAEGPLQAAITFEFLAPISANHYGDRHTGAFAPLPSGLQEPAQKSELLERVIDLLADHEKGTGVHYSEAALDALVEASRVLRPEYPNWGPLLDAATPLRCEHLRCPGPCGLPTGPRWTEICHGARFALDELFSDQAGHSMIARRGLAIVVDPPVARDATKVVFGDRVKIQL